MARPRPFFLSYGERMVIGSEQRYPGTRVGQVDIPLDTTQERLWRSSYMKISYRTQAMLQVRF